MNKVVLIGRLTKDPEIRYTVGENPKVVARYSLAVVRRFKKEGEPSVDYIGCVAFGTSAEFAEKYFYKGIKIAVTGRIQTGSYIDRDGKKIYTTNIVIEEQEFAESKDAAAANKGNGMFSSSPKADGFMNIPDGIDEDLPFK